MNQILAVVAQMRLRVQKSLPAVRKTSKRNMIPVIQSRKRKTRTKVTVRVVAIP